MNKHTNRACIQAPRTIPFTFLISLFPLLYSFHVNAQDHYVPGYVVLRSGDTLHGFINDQEWRTNPKTIQFKKSQSQKETTYTPVTIVSFRIVSGNWYYSFIGPLEQSPWKTNELSHELTLDTFRDMLFTRALVVGHANLLYAFDDRHGDHFFIQKKGGPITELYYKKFLKATDKGDIPAVNEAYKGQLVAAFNDCASVNASLMSIPLSYTDKDLIGLFQRYNKCFQNKTIYTETKSKSKFEPIILAGINYTFLDFKSHDPTFNEIKFNSKLGYAFGVGLNCILPRSRGKFSLYPELLVKNYNSEGTGPGGSVLFPTTDKLAINLLYLKLNAMARFQKPDGNIRPFGEIGISNGLALKHEIYLDDPNSDHEPFMSMRTWEIGIVAGGGARFKNFQLDARVELSNGFSELTGLRTIFTSLYLLTAYKF